MAQAHPHHRRGGTADLLVGADGIDSHVRELVFRPGPRLLRYLGYHTASFLFDDDAVAARIQGQFRTPSLPKRQGALLGDTDRQQEAALLDGRAGDGEQDDAVLG